MKKCPYCAEEIQDNAIVCRFCGRDLATPFFKPEVRRDYANHLEALNTQRTHELDNLKSAKNQRNIGGIALLIGIFLAVFVNMYFGGFILLAGFLAYITQAVKASNTQRTLDLLDKKILEYKQQTYQ